MHELVYYYPHGHEQHMERGHPERPERVETIREALLQADLWESYTKLQPVDLPALVLESVHTPAYLHLLELTCARAGHLDMDTYTTPASWNLALSSAGGAAAVASAVWDGKARRGFALTRPPGHHAMRGQGMGFCLLNNIAIAAEYLIENRGARKLAILDIDLHHGNGSQDIFWQRKDVFYLSTHQSPFYPGTGGIEDIGEADGHGWTANLPLPAGSGDRAFQTVLEKFIIPLLNKTNPEMILVSWGFDAHWLDPLGQLLLSADGYAHLIRGLCNWADQHCEGKIALFLEGGYDLRAAQACSIASVQAMLGQPWEDPYPCPYEESEHWRFSLQKGLTLWEL